MPIELLMAKDLTNERGLKWRMRRWKDKQAEKQQEAIEDAPITHRIAQGTRRTQDLSFSSHSVGSLQSHLMTRSFAAALFVCVCKKVFKNVRLVTVEECKM